MLGVKFDGINQHAVMKQIKLKKVFEKWASGGGGWIREHKIKLSREIINDRTKLCCTYSSSGMFALTDVLKSV